MENADLKLTDKELAVDDMACVMQVYRDAEALINSLERLRANKTLQVPALQCFIQLLDEGLHDLLMGDWQAMAEKAGGLAPYGTKLPTLDAKPSAPITPRTYNDVKEQP